MWLLIPPFSDSGVSWVDCVMRLFGQPLKRICWLCSHNSLDPVGEKDLEAMLS